MDRSGAANLGTTTLTNSATTGSITLVSNRNFFHSGHAGALFRLTHSSQTQTAILAGNNQFTAPIRISGIEPGRVFVIVASGLAGSTLTLQRSFSEPGSWVDVQTYTADGTCSLDDGLDNPNLLLSRRHQDRRLWRRHRHRHAAAFRLSKPASCAYAT